MAVEAVDAAAEAEADAEADADAAADAAPACSHSRSSFVMCTLDRP